MADALSILRGILLTGILLAAQASFALDITTSKGTVYQQCKVEQVDGEFLVISNSEGIARILYDELPAEVQKQYFDGAKIAADRAHREAERKSAEAKAAEERRAKEEAAARAAEQKQEAITRRREWEAAETARFQDEARWLNLWFTVKENAPKGVFYFALIVGGLAFYFLPTVMGEKKESARAIFYLNLFAGWSIIGWIAAFIWAIKSPLAEESLKRA